MSHRMIVWRTAHSPETGEMRYPRVIAARLPDGHIVWNAGCVDCRRWVSEHATEAEALAVTCNRDIAPTTTHAMITEIRSLWLEGWTAIELASRFGLGESYVGKVGSGAEPLAFRLSETERRRIRRRHVNARTRRRREAA